MIRPAKTTIDVPAPASRNYVRAFARRDAAHVSDWVTDEHQLHWLAPGTPPPLSREKVLAWTRRSGRAFVLCDGRDRTPSAYGEVHAMRNPPRSVWLGHVIVSPCHRRRGLGRCFMTELLRYGFEQMTAERAVLIVFPANRPAMQCYVQLGFVQVGHEYHRFPGSLGRERLVRLELTAEDFQYTAATPAIPAAPHRPRPPGSTRRHPAGFPQDATSKAG
jgi:RimJ/RimL family protein N-acetyltransferase